MEIQKEKTKLPLQTPQIASEIPNKQVSQSNILVSTPTDHTPRTATNPPTSKNNTPRAAIAPFRTIREGVVYTNRSSPMMTTLLFLLAFRGTPIEQEDLFEYVDSEIEQKPHRRSNLKRSWMRMRDRGLIEMSLKDYCYQWKLTILGDHVAVQIYNMNRDEQTTNSNRKYNGNFWRGMESVKLANKQWQLANEQGIPF